MNKKYKIKISDLLFYIAYSFYLISCFLVTTTFNKIIVNDIVKVLDILTILILFMKILLSRYKRSTFLILSILTLMTFISYIFNFYYILLFIILFIIASKDIELEKCTKIYFILISVLLTFTVICSKIGIIENLIYYRNNTQTYRQSFGIIYPTNFAAYLVYLILAYVYIRKDKLKVIDYLIFILCMYISYHYCDARLDSITIILISIFCIFKNVIQKCLNNSKIVRLIFEYLFLICASLTIFFTLNYNSTSKFYQSIDHAFSGRLSIGHNMINEYGISLFGQNIILNGWGGKTEYSYDYVYNYIDSSYIRILLLYGIIIFIFAVIGNIYIAKKAIKKNDIYLIIILSIISINSIVAQHYMDFSYNFLLIIYLSKYLKSENQTKIE